MRCAVEATRAKYHFDTVAWVLLPDHLHCIWTLPDQDADFTTRWGLVKTRFTREFIRAGGAEASELSLSRQHRKERGIWQRRFWEHCLRDEDDLWYHIRYIHYNPVKHSLVEDPRVWPYSTIHRSEYSDWVALAPEDRLDAPHLEGE